MKQHNCIVRLSGGLGNQLFQYAAGLTAVRGSVGNLYVDTTYYLYVRNRRYILKDLSLEAKVISLWNHPLEYPLSLPIIGDTWSTLYTHLFPSKFRRYKEKELLVFDKELQRINSDVYLDGFWQHRSYIDLVEDRLKQSLHFSKNTTELEGKYTGIKSNLSVSIHVRRGDYARVPWTKICPASYYIRSMEYMRSQLSVPKFYFFSDDLTWCKNEFGKQEDIVYVENTESELADFYLMRECQHHIIANSTFSWWGARLGRGHGIVVLPKAWSNQNGASSAFTCPGWKPM